jgi:hypothetical protein
LFLVNYNQQLKERKMKRILSIAIVLTLTDQALAATQGASLYNWEVQAITGYHDGLTAQGLPQMNSIGGIQFHKFANESGDWAALNLQFDLAWTGAPLNESNRLGTSLLTQYNMRPLQFRLHQADFELKRFGPFTTLWVGHNRPAFGLNPVLDTHGTTWHSFAMQSLGVEEDWGLGGNGYLGSTDWRFSLTTHSDMAINDKGGLAALRWGFGDPTETSTFWGVSAAGGFVQAQSWNLGIDPLWEGRLGGDLRTTWGRLGIQTELVSGYLNEMSLWGMWLRLPFQIVPETLFLSPQYSAVHVLGTSGQAQLELEYKPLSWLSLRLGEQHNQNPMMGEPEGYLTYLSLYIRR